MSRYLSELEFPCLSVAESDHVRMCCGFMSELALVVPVSKSHADKLVNVG